MSFHLHIAYHIARSFEGKYDKNMTIVTKYYAYKKKANMTMFVCAVNFDRFLFLRCI